MSNVYEVYYLDSANDFITHDYFSKYESAKRAAKIIFDNPYKYDACSSPHISIIKVNDE